MKTPRQIKLKWASVPPKNINRGFALSNLLGLFKSHKLTYEARVLENLRTARSNYFYALQHREKTSAYKRSLNLAVAQAHKLIQELQKCPYSNIFGTYVDIELYIQYECLIQK